MLHHWCVFFGPGQGWIYLHDSEEIIIDFFVVYINKNYFCEQCERGIKEKRMFPPLQRD